MLQLPVKREKTAEGQKAKTGVTGLNQKITGKTTIQQKQNDLR